MRYWLGKRRRREEAGTASGEGAAGSGPFIAQESKRAKRGMGGRGRLLVLALMVGLVWGLWPSPQARADWQWPSWVPQVVPQLLGSVLNGLQLAWGWIVSLADAWAQSAADWALSHIPMPAWGPLLAVAGWFRVANTWLPVGELLTMLGLYYGWLLALAAFRWTMRFIPGMG